MPAGTLDQPSCSPTSSSYSLLDAQEMNFQALSFFLLASWMLHDQAYSQPELVGLHDRRRRRSPILPLTGESAASSEPAAEVASYHIADVALDEVVQALGEPGLRRADLAVLADQVDVELRSPR